ncbi:MAG: carbohydrate binding domain-containing protein [Candidatus Omnitrophota bacterium]|nr:carbohydrate binding domain-containing protein [Candidatus Omnitrophota bacterium]
MSIIKKILSVSAVSVLFFVFMFSAFAQGTEELVLDDFEGVISGGEHGTVDFGSGGGSTVEVAASQETKQHGEQSLEAKFEAVAGGYMWIARGYDLTVKGAGCWQVKPEEIDFSKYNAFSVYVHGANTGTQIAIDLVDGGFEYWRYFINDDFTGWKEIVIPFGDFFARGDWQPEKADKNGAMDFPLKVFQFEPRPEAKGTLYFDYVRLVKKQ